MEKKITICGKEFEIKSSAFTPFAYKNFTGTDLLKDLNKINKLNNEIQKIKDEQEKNEIWLEEAFPIIELSLNMAYVMIKEKNKNIPNYEEFVSSLDSLLDDTTWISDVMEAAISPFSRQLQKNQNIQQ